MKVFAVGDFDRMGHLGRTCPRSCSLPQCNSIPTAREEQADTITGEKEAPSLTPHYLQNGLGDTSRNAEGNVIWDVICYICYNISVTSLDLECDLPYAL